MQKHTPLPYFFGFLLLPILAFSQDAPMLFGDRTEQILARLEIHSGNAQNWPIHSDVRPFSRRNAAAAAAFADTSKVFSLTKTEREALLFLKAENADWQGAAELPKTLTEKIDSQNAQNERVSSKSGLLKRPILGIFYRSRANFFEVDSKYFQLRANPVLDFSLGKQDDLTGLQFFNRRGIDLRGDVDNRLFFWTSIYETQARLPEFVRLRIEKDDAIPGAPRFKNFGSRLFKVDNGYDFLIANAGIGFYATKHIGVQLGHGTNFIGNGYRSMLLSDFSAPYFFLKLNTQVWRFHYQNIFAELGQYPTAADRSLPRKYLAAHYLSFNFTKNLSAGLFETVVLNRNDHFEFQYLNPVILYRTIENAIGSPDNVLLGLNARWNVARKAQIYGQLMLDEFLFSLAILPKEGQKKWWGNKQAAQLGIKMPRLFGLDRVDFQAEMNAARPYTYSHIDSTKTNYAHLHQPLAHPLGANFREFLAILRWRPTKKIAIEARVFHIRTGEDAAAGENFGSNILLSSATRPADFGVFQFQGAESKIRLAALEASYEIFHNGFFDFRASFRQKSSENALLSRRDVWVSAGFRMNVAPRRWDF